MTAVEQLRALGYVVDDTDARAVAVRGFGVATMVGSGDAATLAALASPKAHAERKAQHLRHRSPRENALDG